MSKQYQNDTSKNTAAGPVVTVPAEVTVALQELTGQVQEGLLSPAVATGLQVMASLMEADVAAVAGPRGKQNPDRAAVRHGSGPGSVILGGRRVPIVRPRVRAADGSGELPVPSYEMFSSTELLGRLAMEKMLAGLSTRRYRVGLEPVGAQVAREARSTSRSAVSRRFVERAETALDELLAADLAGLVEEDVDGAPARGAADAGPHPAVHQRDRVNDRDLPQPRPQRQALAGRADGAALVRRRHGRGPRPVPPGQRPSASGETRR